MSRQARAEYSSGNKFQRPFKDGIALLHGVLQYIGLQGLHEILMPAFTKKSAVHAGMIKDMQEAALVPL